MTQISWRLIDSLSGLLTPDERDAVLGDLAESGETGGKALLGVLGLVVRRQAALWKNWRPWLALVVVVVPLGMLLTVVSRRTAGLTSVYAWMYLNNWTVGYLGPGFRIELLQYIAGFCATSLALACWAWTFGFVLAFLSRRATAVNALLFFLASFLAQLLTATREYDSHSPNAAVFSLTLYKSILPLLSLALLVFIPAWKGMRDGLHPAGLSFSLKSIVGICVVITVAALFAGVLRPRWQRDAFLFSIAGPLGYKLIATISRRRRLHR